MILINFFLKWEPIYRKKKSFVFVNTMSVYYPYSEFPPSVYLNNPPPLYKNVLNYAYTNKPVNVHYPYTTNDLTYNYSPQPPFSYSYSYGADSPPCRCDVFHTIADCVRRRSFYQCP